MSLACVGRHLECRPRLADARLTDQQRHATLPRESSFDNGAQLSQLLLASHERFC